MAGQGAKGGGQVAMPAAQAMGGSRGPMGPQGTLYGPSIVMPSGVSSGDVNMGGNVSVATGPIDTGLGTLGPQPPAPSYNFTYDQAVGRQQQRDIKPPAEQAAISAAIAAGPSAGSQMGPQQTYPMSDIYQGPPLQQGPNALTAMLPPSGPTMRPNPNLPNQGLPMPSGGLKGGIFGQQPRPVPQPSQDGRYPVGAQYAPLAPQGQFNVNQAAAGALQQAMGATQQGLGFTPMGIRPTAYRPSQIAGTSLAPYTNPYESQVVQQTMRDIGTAQEQALNLQGAQAQRANAFGGSRQGIAEAETRLGYGQQALDAASRLRQQGYQTALGLAGQDVGAQTAASQFAAQQQASAQAQNLAAQQAAMGTRLGAAQQLAGLGQQAFGTGQAIQQQQMQQGLLQQMLQQSLIDAAKAQYAGYTGAPQAALAAPLAALGATPDQSTTTKSMQPGLFNYLQLGASMFPR